MLQKWLAASLSLALYGYFMHWNRARLWSYYTHRYSSCFLEGTVKTPSRIAAKKTHTRHLHLPIA
jgi:hypothetical protein